MEQQRDTTIKWEHIAANIGHFRALLGRNIDQLSFEDPPGVVQLLVEKVVVHPDGAIEVHHVLPFEEPPVAADPKKKGIPGEFYVLRLKQLHVPATPVQRHDQHLGGEHRGRQRGTDQHPAGQKEALRGRCAFFMALPAFVPGPMGLLRVQARGRATQPRTSCWPPVAQSATARVRSVSVCCRFKAAHSSKGAPTALRSTTLKGWRADDEIGSLLDRRTHALTLGITAAVGHGDIAGRQGEMLERFARMEIFDLVFRLATGTVDFLVEHLGAGVFQVSDHKASVDALLGHFDFDHHATRTRPRPCLVARRVEAGDLLATAHVGSCGLLDDLLGQLLQYGVARQASDVAHTWLRFDPLHHFRVGKVAVTANDHQGLRPCLPQSLDQALQPRASGGL